MDYQTTISEGIVKWPFEVDYEITHHIRTDVLVIGGGLAGCAAGISACRNGSSVAVVDKGPIIRSGCGGAGMDHFNAVLDNPKSPITPDDNVELLLKHGQSLGHRDYIALKGSWNALMELEDLGLPIRDNDHDFADSPMIDPETNLFPAYDYSSLASVKLRGGNFIKPVLYEGLKKAGAKLFDRIMVTSLLTENGRIGGRIAGATGFSMETGAFYVFHAKSVIISTGYICSCWIYNLDITGNSYRWDPNEVGDGFAMAWKIGAKVFGMHKNGTTRASNPFSWPRFGAGHPATSWYPCSIVDNKGREIPWINVKGEPLSDFLERNQRPEHFDVCGFGMMPMPELTKDLPKLIRDGTYELPLWADLAGLPEYERKSIWGLMIGNEGKTRYTLYDYFTRAGFNPETDMIMCPIMSPESYKTSFTWFKGEDHADKTWRSENGGQGEIACDWNLMTNIDGLYCAGAAGGLEGSSFALSSGFYVGERAAERSKKTIHADIDAKQLADEHERVYAPTKRTDDPAAYISWKELWGGSARAMQQCCTDFKTVSVLDFGINWMKTLREQELQQTYARNPHELARVLEAESRITCSEAFLHCCKSRIEADKDGIDPDKYLFNYVDADGKVKISLEEDHYWLKPPYASTYAENYQIYSGKRKDAETETPDQYTY